MAFEVVAPETNGCPRAEAVSERLRQLAPKLTDSSEAAMAVIVVTTANQMVISLRRDATEAAPALVDEKRLDASESCDDRAHAAAALLAAWLAAPPAAMPAHTETKAETHVQPKTPLRATVSSSSDKAAWALSLAAGALLLFPVGGDEAFSPPGLSVDWGFGPRPIGLQILLHGYLSGTSVVSFESASANVRSWGIRVGPAYVAEVAGGRLLGAVQCGVMRLFARGKGFEFSEQGGEIAPDLALRLRGSSPAAYMPWAAWRGNVRLFVAGGLITRLARQALVSEDPALSREVARTRLELIFGLEFHPSAANL